MSQIIEAQATEVVVLPDTVPEPFDPLALNNLFAGLLTIVGGGLAAYAVVHMLFGAGIFLFGGALLAFGLSLFSL